MTRWPPLPRAVELPGGPVRVVRIKGYVIHHDGTQCLGTYDHETRTIRIARAVRGRQRWHTFFHEWVHAALIDAGIDNQLPHSRKEAVCDALATARVRERFG